MKTVYTIQVRIHVLYLDDEPLICECFVEQNSREDILISTFQEPDEAVEFAKKNNIDLIFLDFRMPGIRGDKVALQMPTGIPIYLLSGELNAQPEFEFVDILAKPFDNQRIREILEATISAKKNRSFFP
jgi:DNA-binding NtrC family response regulator